MHSVFDWQQHERLAGFGNGNMQPTRISDMCYVNAHHDALLLTATGMCVMVCACVCVRACVRARVPLCVGGQVLCASVCSCCPNDLTSSFGFVSVLVRVVAF